MQKKHLFLSFVIFLSVSTLAVASSPSPSLTPSPSPSPADINQVTENIKKRLQEATGTPTIPLENQSTLRAYVGTVRDVIKETVVVEDKDGKKNVVVDDSTTILRSPGNKEIKIEDVRIDDSIIAIGYIKGENELTGRRLIVSTTPIAIPNKLADIGTITKITETSLTVASKNMTYDLALTGKTVIKSTNSTVLEPSDLAVGDKVVFTALSDDKSKTATIIMRIKLAE